MKISSITKFLFNTTTFNNASIYIQQYNRLSKKVQEESQQILQLKKKIQSLEIIATVSLSDRIKQSIYSIFNKTYETNQIRIQQQKLKQYRQILQKAILNSQQKWEQPRKLIIQTKQQIINQFILDLIPLEKQLAVLKQLKAQQSLVQASQLNYRYLANIMLKEQAQEIIPKQGNFFNQNEHQKVQGQGNIIDRLLTKGWKIKNKVCLKAKVTLKNK